MPLHHPAFAREPEKPSVRAFFEETLRVAIEAQPETCARIGGRYNFTVVGEGGGAWTVDFIRARIEEGASSEATVHLTADVAVFQGILAGNFDPLDVLGTDRLRIEGDGQELRNVLAILP